MRTIPPGAADYCTPSPVLPVCTEIKLSATEVFNETTLSFQFRPGFPHKQRVQRSQRKIITMKKWLKFDDTKPDHHTQNSPAPRPTVLKSMHTAVVLNLLLSAVSKQCKHGQNSCHKPYSTSNRVDVG
ncbi:unnamed protein product [Ectocarpus sp. 8 AP-2014]